VDDEVQVYWAQDYETARELVITTYFSLIVIDLVLDETKETVPDQWGGLMLIWDIVDLNLQGSRAVVVRTSYPDPDVERRAFGRYGVADFLTKKGSTTRELAAEFQELVAQRNYFGMCCLVDFQDGLSWEEMVRVCTRRQNQALAARMGRDLGCAELEGLFRLTFDDCRGIAVHPMSLGASGTGLVRVEREFMDGSRGASVVAKFGDIEMIQRELDGWHHLEKYLHAARATEIISSRLGLGLGVLEYRFLGAGVEQLRTFDNFYATASARDVERSVDRLFRETCALWYEESNRTAVEQDRLDAYYQSALGIDVERLVKGYEFRFGKPCRVEEVVSYAELDHDLPHVVAMMQEGALRFLTDTWRCRTHGDLHSQNLLVTQDDGQCWLVDFGRSGSGHWARDFAILESSIRFQMLLNNDLNDLFEFESVMAAPEELGGTAELSGIRDPSTLKAAEVIQALRRTAAGMVDPYPRDRAFAEYLVALVFASTKLLEFHQLLDRKWRKHHVLIACGVMLDRLRIAADTDGLIGWSDRAEH
ncbi:MAG TPA: phosphotransferase, partial [Solirubrobacterales bacterium]|nr:phosphotransferase [Solirubrobacterales bacterium]